MDKDTRHITGTQLNRRTILRAGAVAGTAVLLGSTGAPVLAGHRPGKHADGSSQVEPEAGTWKTWVLQSGDQLRLPKPPHKGLTRAEVEEVAQLGAGRDAAALDAISYWDTGSPGYRWNQIAIAKGLQASILLRNYRLLALMNVAIYDATVAAWDSKYTYFRPRPSEFNFGGFKPAVTTAIPNPDSPSYPCEHSVAAGAASAVLSYIFPDDAQFFADKADEAAHSRLLAGVAHRSDAEAGLELGRAVAALVIERAMHDGSDAAEPLTIPAGPGLWNGDPASLAEPLMGTWQSWTLASNDQHRPAPPPAHDSQERAAELAEVKNYLRDAAPGSELSFWPEDPAGRPAPDSGPFSSNQVVFYYAPVVHLTWNPELTQKLFEYRLDENAPRAARAYALVSIAGYDATIAAWEAKFHYWTARPNQFDPAITTILPTYPIPDYPSGHAGTLGGTSAMLAYLFPRDAAFFHSRAEEQAASRLWAGIHFRSACDAGVQLGRDVAQNAIAWAQGDGADSA